MKSIRLAMDSSLLFSMRMIYSWWIWPSPTVISFLKKFCKNIYWNPTFDSTAMYTPRLLDNQPVNHALGLATANANNAVVTSVIPSTVIDSTSDSAVSSMGSERGPSISDDWIDTSNATDSNSTSVAGATAVLPSGSAYGMEYSSG